MRRLLAGCAQVARRLRVKKTRHRLSVPRTIRLRLYSPTQLNGTPSSTERLRKIEPHPFPYTIWSPQPCLQNLKLLRYACKMHFVSYHAWKHPIFNWQPAYTTRRSNASTIALTASRARYRGLAVIRSLINTRRLCSYAISIEWTVLESAHCSTKSTITRSVSWSSTHLTAPNHLLLDATGLRDSLNET